MGDTIAYLGKTKIQHGKAGDRIYVMELAIEEVPGVIDQLEELAAKEEYGKIFAKVPERVLAEFTNRGYEVEATVPGFFKGEETGHFIARFLKEGRRRDPQEELVAKIIATAKGKEPVERPSTTEVALCTTEDAEEMAQVYKVVFETYPFPIHDPAYLRETMTENIVYFKILHEGRIVALSSAEMYEGIKAVEMTDFATLPAARKHGYATKLLFAMEEEMRKRGVKTAYTIARAVSFGMNITFAKCGYAFAGTLVLNTDISGELESMNVWYKAL